MRIINLQFIYQSKVSRRCRKDIVRKRSIDGPFRNREYNYPIDIEVGSGSNANIIIRRIIAEHLRSAKPEELFFYVVAKFDTGENIFFKTIVPRSEIPKI